MINPPRHATCLATYLFLDLRDEPDLLPELRLPEDDLIDELDREELREGVTDLCRLLLELSNRCLEVFLSGRS